MMEGVDGGILWWLLAVAVVVAAATHSHRRTVQEAEDRKLQRDRAQDHREAMAFLEERLLHAEEERTRLIELLMQLRAQGERAGPEAFDEHWGRYTFRETEESQMDLEEKELSDRLREQISDEF